MERYKKLIVLVFSVALLLSVLSCDNSANGSGNGNGNGVFGNENRTIVLTNAEFSNLITWTGETAELNFSSNTSGTYYFIIRLSTSAPPTIQQVINQTTNIFSPNAAMGTGVISQKEMSIQVSGLTHNREYTAYIVARNASSTSELIVIPNFRTTGKIRNWTVVNRPPIFGNDHIQGFVFADGQFVAVSGRRIFTSVDGIYWEAADMGLPTNRNVISGIDPGTGLAYGNGIFVVLVTGRQPFFSNDGGKTWQEGSNPFADIDGFSWPLRFVRFAGDRFIISTESSATNLGNASTRTIFSYSKDGMNWNLVSRDDGWTISDSRARYDDVAYGNGKHIAVRFRGHAISTDGFATTNWTDREHNLWHHGSVITYNHIIGSFIVASARTVFFSTDGISWTSMNAGAATGPSARRIVFTDGAIVIGTDRNDIFISHIGEEFTRFAIPGFSSIIQQTSLLAYGNGRFVILGGQPGLQNAFTN